MIRIMEVFDSGENIVRKQGNINEVLVGNWLQKKYGMANNNVGSGERGSNIGYASVLQGESSEFIGSQAFRNVVKNIFDIQEKSGILKSKPDTETTSEKVQSTPLGRLEIDVEAQKRIDEAVKKYGAMKKGVAPTRDVALPKRTENDRFQFVFEKICFFCEKLP